MKLTENGRLWILQQVSKYAEQIGIIEKDRPAVVFTRKELLAMPKEFTEGRRTVAHKYLGICFCGAKTIFINVKKFRSTQDMKHTIVHELVHYRFRYLKHGKRFEDRINLILSKDKRYPAKDLLYYPNTDDTITTNTNTAISTICTSSCQEEVQQQDERWTTERLIDELFLHLVCFTETMKNNKGQTFTVKKYHRHAYDLLPRIPVAKPTPAFIIYLSDLTPKLLQELKGSRKEERRYVVIQSVGRIFENINSRLYHLSIARKLKVEFK
jgi:hypothetical protein